VASDAVIISFAEHNGVYATAFKNIMDWKSRIPDSKTWEDKQMFVLSTSPGKRAGSNIMAVVKSHFPHQGTDIQASFSLPSFYANYSTTDGITSGALKQEFEDQVTAFKEALNLKA
jgi:chromate reductase